MRHRWWAFLLVALAGPVSLVAQGRDCEAPGAVQLAGLDFQGNKAISEDTLAAAIELERPGSRLSRFFKKNEKHCANSRAIVEDLARLILLYRRRGFPGVRVDTTVQRPKRDQVRVRFVITEGDPIVVDSVAVRGIADDTLRKTVAKDLTPKSGAPLDRVQLAASRAAVVNRLRQRAFLNARADTSTIVDTAARRGTAVITVTLGPQVRLGTLSIRTADKDGGSPRVSAEDLRGLVGLRSGDLLGTTQLDKARRTLYDTGVQQDVDIRVDSVRAVEDGTATANVRISAVEGSSNEFQLNSGWGTIDCVRVEATLQRAAALVPTGRFQVRGWVSKVGLGDPLDFAPGICSEAVRNDPYSAELNYHLGITYGLPAIGSRKVSWSASLYTERRSEYLAYLLNTYIGSTLSVTRSFGRWPVTLAHNLTYGSTQAEPAVLCASFSACLPEDRQQVTQPHSLGVLSGVISRDRTNHPVDPTSGGTLRGEVRAGLSWFGTVSNQQFMGARVDATRFFPTGSTTVLAFRLRGALVGNVGAGTFIPQQERLYAGGPTTIRGYGQNLVGPKVYVVDSVRRVVEGNDTLFSSTPSDPGWNGVPTGGDALVVGGVEFRWRPAGVGSLVQFVGFVDAGAVWQRGSTTEDLRFRGIGFTPGVGVRVFTPVGPFRLDIGYDPYAPRAGTAYRDTPLGLSSAPLYCVSPGNTLTVSGTGAVDAQGDPIPPVQEPGPCPATFAPERPGNFFDRLVLHFSIGQAF